MSEFATVEDVRGMALVDIPDYITDEKIQTWIDAAERTLRSKVPSLDARLAAGRITVDDVNLVVCNMLLRVLRNPSGYRTETEGDYSYAVDTAIASGRLLLDRTDRELLGQRYTAGTIPVADPALPMVPVHRFRERHGRWWGVPPRHWQ